MTDEQAKTVWKRLPGASVGLRMGRGHAYVRVAAGTPEPPTYPPTLAWRSRDATFYIFAGNDRGRNIRAGVQFRCGGSAVLAPPNAQLTMINDAPSAQLPRWWDL